MAKKPAKKIAKKVAPKKMVAKKAKTAAAKPTKVTQSAAGRVIQVVDKTRVINKPKNGSTGSYTYSEFVENLRSFCGLAKRSQAKELAEDIASLIKDSLRKGYKLPLFGLGKIYVRHSKARIGRNPQTGETMPIPARKRVRFTAAKALKEAVLK